MSRIDNKFRELAVRGEKAFIPFITAGDPDRDTTLEILRGAFDAGADLVELGFPFSDPVADGPTIQASYNRVLEGGQKNEDIFRMVESLRETSRIPIVAMISYSLVFKMGFERFVERALDAGIDGATIPDLPAEEVQDFVPHCRRAGFSLISFITPATDRQRRARLLSLASGFVYYISVRGITGERSEMPADLKSNLRELRKQTDLPVAVGFGISGAEQAREIAAHADGVIVGSAIVKRIHQSVLEGRNPSESALEFIADVARAVKSVR